MTINENVSVIGSFQCSSFSHPESCISDPAIQTPAGGVVKLNSDTTDVLNVKVAYTDEDSDSQTLTFAAMNLSGTVSPSIGPTTGIYTLIPRAINAMGGIDQTISISTDLATGGGSTNYDLALSISQVQ